MRALAHALRYALLCSVFALVGACKKKEVMVVYADNHPTINLFGFEESQLHHIHNTVELHRNIFLVRFDPAQPNNLEWVNCPISATYKYQAAKGRRVESMYISSYQDLQAKVPVNYARFAGYVKNGKALEFNYVAIGSYELLSDFKIPENDPDCARATHYVVTLSVGAFNYAEKKATEGGLEVAEKTTGIGVGASAGRESGESTSVGDLDSCMDNQAALHGCFTPLQLMMMPLASRHWTTDAVEESAPPVARADIDTTDGRAPAETVATDLSLHIDGEAWRPGSFMAMALEKILIMATRIDVSTDFGFDDKGSTVVAGFLRADHPQIFSRTFEQGKSYAVVGAGATGANIDIKVTDSSGDLVVADTDDDGNPTVTFSAPATDTYKIELSVIGQAEEFGALVVMTEHEGTRIPADVLQQVFQRLLDAGAFASAKVVEMGFPNGLVFHEDTWSVQGTILYPGEVIRQSNISLDSNSHVFAAVSHEDSFNIDLEVIEASTGQSWSDVEPDSNPVVIVDKPDPSTSYDVRVIYGEGESETLATSLILRLSD